jgi:nucleotide-binding universal stress UspA family protein
MAKRILLVVREGAHAARQSAALAAGRLARESGGAVRMMYVSPLPPARMDRHDRMVANIDQEMMRITGEGQDCLARLAAEIPDVPVERVVRFGRLKDEVRIEAEAFAADLVALAAPLSPGPWHRALAWYLGRVALASKTPVVLLPVSTQGPERGSRDAVAMPAH